MHYAWVKGEVKGGVRGPHEPPLDPRLRASPTSVGDVSHKCNMTLYIHRRSSLLQYAGINYSVEGRQEVTGHSLSIIYVYM